MTAFYNILRKDVKNYYLKPPNISWGILFPLAWTLMQFLSSPAGIDLRQLLPGLMGMSILFGTTSMLAVTITFERKGRSFERLLLAPISLSAMMLAKITGAILFGIINAFVPVLFASFFTDISGIHWGFAVLGVVLISVTSTLLGLLIAISAKEVFEAQTYSNFFRFPMLFLCGLFIPISQLPMFLRPISYALPLTYGASLLRYAILDERLLNPLVSICILIAFVLVLFYLARRLIETRWIL